MRNLTPEEILREWLLGLAMVYEKMPKGTPYAEEIYEELVWVEERLRDVEALHEEGKGLSRQEKLSRCRCAARNLKNFVSTYC
jgi:hypothetical protein